MSIDTSRLDACGWSSFDPDLFLMETGRVERDVSASFVRILERHSAGHRVLELCCGGGALAIALARAGYRVTGLDLSGEMLDVCRGEIEQRCEDVRERITLVQADMCTFELGQTFDFIILEDDSFMYLLTQDDQLACLRRVHQHLSNDGCFLLAFETPQHELARDEEATYDPIHQIRTVTCTWTVLRTDGERQTVRQGIERRRLTYPCELELLLRCASLEPIHRWGDFQMTPFTNPRNQQYVFLMKRA